MKFFALILLTVFTQIANSKTLETANQKLGFNTSIKTDTVFNQPADTFQKISNIPTKIVVMNNNDENLWVSVGLPILTFALGILFPILIESLSKRKKSKNALNRWTAEIGNLQSPMSRQIEAIDKFLEEQTDFKFDISPMATVKDLDCSNFDSMDKGEFLNAIKTHKKLKFEEAVKISSSTNGYVSIIKYTDSVLKKKFQDYLDGTSKQISEFNIHFNELLKSFSDYGVEIEKETGLTPELNPAYKELMDLFNIHIFPKQSTGDYNAFTLENDFFKPLMEALSDLRLDERIKPIVLSCSKCALCIKAMKMERTYVRKNLNLILEKYKKQLSELEGVLTDLKV